MHYGSLGLSIREDGLQTMYFGVFRIHEVSLEYYHVFGKNSERIGSLNIFVVRQYFSSLENKFKESRPSFYSKYKYSGSSQLVNDAVY